MLTIIKRISASVREGNFQTLFFELIVVAMGIFLGLQADQWYENRQDAERLEEYLERLMGNVQSDIDSLTDGIELTQTRLEMVDLLNLSVSNLNVAKEDPANYLRALQQATFRFGQGSSARDATFNELTSTGDMRLIPIEVRDKIYEYYKIVEDRGYFVESVNGIQAESNRRFAGILVLGDLETALALNSPNNHPETLTSRAVAAAERFRNTEEAIVWLAELATMHRLEIGISSRRLGIAKDMVVALEEKLGG